MKQTLYFPSLLFFHCSKSSQQKVLWKVGVLTFFCRNSWKAQTNNFLSSYCCKLESYTFTTKFIKVTIVTKCFSLILSWQLCRATISKNTHFFQYSLSNYFCKLYCWLHYSASLWINLLSSVCAYTLKFAFPSLLKLAY